MAGASRDYVSGRARADKGDSLFHFSTQLAGRTSLLIN